MDSGVIDQEDFEELLDAVIGPHDRNIQRAFIECLKNAEIVFE